MTTIVLSAGGTGGHLFPAQALAQELLRRGRRIVVMTDGRGRHYESAFPDATIASVPSATFAGGAFSRIMAPFRIAVGVAAAFGKLLRLRPSAVIGFGGYPSLPVMAAACIAGFPTAIHEQNAVLGRVNRLLAPRVEIIAGSLPLVRFLPPNADRVIYTGNPVRAEAAKLGTAPYEPPSKGGEFRLLIFGGSQGARALSEIVPQAIARLASPLRDRLQIVQQCRSEDIDSVRAIYAAAGVTSELAGFFEDLPARMAAAHLVICRSGASTVSELAAIGRPSILVPYPFATDDHQTANAGVMVDAAAGWCVQQRDLSPVMLASMIARILDDPEELVKRAHAAKALAAPDAAQRLADLVDRIAGIHSAAAMPMAKGGA
jgi:UDP-N-acetylglucosamine--N-acetylmuramyl-(pentapeptide) pyrophosphoryl-undecaprenol N-acetylglucosamine transferase